MLFAFVSLLLLSTFCYPTQILDDDNVDVDGEPILVPSSRRKLLYVTLWSVFQHKNLLSNFEYLFTSKIMKIDFVFYYSTFQTSNAKILHVIYE